MPFRSEDLRRQQNTDAPFHPSKAAGSMMRHRQSSHCHWCPASNRFVLSPDPLSLWLVAMSYSLYTRVSQRWMFAQSIDKAAVGSFMVVLEGLSSIALQMGPVYCVSCSWYLRNIAILHSSATNLLLSGTIVSIMDTEPYLVVRTL